VKRPALLVACVAAAVALGSGGPGVAPSLSTDNIQVSAPISGNGSSGSPLTCTSASASAGGCVSTSAQVVPGLKTFAADAGFTQNVGVAGQLSVGGNLDAGTLIVPGSASFGSPIGITGLTRINNTSSGYHLQMCDSTNNKCWTLQLQNDALYFFNNAGGIPYTFGAGGATSLIAGGSYQIAATMTLDSTANGLTLKNYIADNASKAALDVDTSTAWTAGNLQTLRNNGTTKYTVGPGGEVTSASTKTRGTITLSGGTGTATVLSGAVCTCTNTSSENAYKCAVSGTTLTATSTLGTTNVIAYHCL
jgi:hypothetical protein